MKVLITGHKGFVGTETVRYFNEVAPMPGGSGGGVKEIHVEGAIEVVGYDIMDGNDIRNHQQLLEFVMNEKPDRILHLAAIARFDEADADPILTHETNVIGTMNVVNVAKRLGIPLVFASTGSAYMPIIGTPPIKETFPIKGNSVYGCSKALAELYVREITPHIVLRYAHLYGAEKRHHGLIGGFMARIQHDLEPVLYGGKQSNDFTYIKDIARANYLAVTASWDAWNQCYNIGTGEELTAEKAGEIICKFAGYTGKIEVREGRTVDPERFFFDTTKAERMLKFKAEYSFEKGLEDMFKGIPSPITTPVEVPATA